MTPLAFVTLCLITFVALAGMSQVPLLQDSITASGFSSTEVFSGLGVILFLFYAVLAVFTVR